MKSTFEIGFRLLGTSRCNSKNIALNKYMLSLVIACFLTSINIYSQNVNMFLNIVTNDYSLSTTDQWSLSIVNGTTNNYKCYLRAKINVENEGIIANGTSRSFKLSTLGTKIFNKNSTELFDSNTVSYNSFYRDAVVLTGQLPSRNYTVCVELINNNNQQVLAKTCREIRLQKFQPPVNVFPFDKDTVEQNALNFQWLPPQPLEKGMRYTIKIAELLSIQSKVSTLFSNNLYFSESSINRTIFQYPINARRLIPGRTYSWIIEAQFDNLIIKSEPTIFTIKPEGSKVNNNPVTQISKFFSFTEIKKNENNLIELQSDSLNIVLKSDYKIKNIPLFILNENNIPVHSTNISLKEGSNYLSLDFSKNTKLKELNNFTILISASKNETYRMQANKVKVKNFKMK